MQITNSTYIDKLNKLKQSYSDLPWYQRWWFSLWSNDLSSALSAINIENPTTEQVERVFKMSEEAWFFKSIFGLLDEFSQAIKHLTYNGQTREIKEQLGEQLDLNDLAALASTSQSEFSFFKTMVDLGNFLTSVVQCNYRKVEAKLKDNNNLFLAKGRITDEAGYSFSDISGFQYALWAGNKEMWLRILESLPKNEEGRTIKSELLKQYQELRDKGVTYRLDGKIRSGSHFIYDQTMVDSINHQIANMHNFNNGPILNNWEEIDQQWHQFGIRAKTTMPLHIYNFFKPDGGFPMGGMIIAALRNRSAQNALNTIQTLNQDFVDLELLLKEPLIIEEQDLRAQTNRASL